MSASTGRNSSETGIIATRFALLLLWLAGCAPSPADHFAAEKTAATGLLTPLLTEHPGIAIAVGWRNRIVWDTAFGYADVAEKIPLLPDDVLRYYSLSKPVTGVALAQLVQKGAVDLEAPVGRYVAVPPAYDRVTIRQLLTHTAGVRHYRDGEWDAVSQRHCPNVTDALSLFINDTLLYPPGTQHTYSTFGYVLLSRVVETASGERFSDYIHRHILARAGMSRTYFDGEEGPPPVIFYATTREPAPPSDNSCRWGGGALLGTTGDLVRFGLALLRHRLLSPAMTRQVFTALPSFPGAPAYSYGFGIGDHHPEYPELPHFAGHSGSGLGGLALFVIFPEQELVLALLSNRQGSEKKMTDVFVEVAEVFLAGVEGAAR